MQDRFPIIRPVIHQSSWFLTTDIKAKNKTKPSEFYLKLIQEVQMEAPVNPLGLQIRCKKEHKPGRNVSAILYYAWNKKK